jgi:HSP20 family molecular chaperone IbpA
MSLNQRLFSDAFRDMQRTMAVFDQPLVNTVRLLNNNRVPLLNGATNLLKYPATDMVETPESYELSSELPGYNKKDIKIELANDNRTLVLSGSVNETKTLSTPTTEAATVQSETPTTKTQPQQDELVTKNEQDNQVAKSNENQWWVKERVSGSFTRSFAFPTSINADSIKASFDNGVLKVIVPKTKETKDEAKLIDIE